MNTKRILKILLNSTLTATWAFLLFNAYLTIQNETFQSSDYFIFGFLALFTFGMLLSINTLILIQHMFFEMDEKPKTTKERFNEIKMDGKKLQYQREKIELNLN